MRFIKSVLFVIGVAIAIAIVIVLLIALRLLVECLLERIGIPNVGRPFRIEDIIRMMEK